MNRKILTAFETIQNIQSNMYAKCGLKFNSFLPEKESLEYCAHTCVLENKNILFRVAKKTPTKTGWFVTIWKRNTANIIAPYDESDPIDFVIIAVLDNNCVGEFIFPKGVLLKNKIFSTNDIAGKRAIRVYTPWDKATSMQAVKTQKWQSQFFVDIKSRKPETIAQIKAIYSM